MASIAALIDIYQNKRYTIYIAFNFWLLRYVKYEGTWTRASISSISFFTCAIMRANSVGTRGIHVTVVITSDALIDI